MCSFLKLSNIPLYICTTALLFLVYGFGVTFGHLYFNAQGYVPALLENQLGMSCSETCWLLVELGFSVGIEAFG